jgi:hypothetical protein
MRWAICAVMVCSAASTSGALPAAARDYPFCIKGCDFGAGVGDCSYSSYQQCLATASGRDATCAANPYFGAKAFGAKAFGAKAFGVNAELQPDRNRQSKRRF